MKAPSLTVTVRVSDGEEFCRVLRAAAALVVTVERTPLTAAARRALAPRVAEFRAALDAMEHIA